MALLAVYMSLLALAVVAEAVGPLGLTVVDGRWLKGHWLMNGRSTVNRFHILVVGRGVHWFIVLGDIYGWLFIAVLWFVVHVLLMLVGGGGGGGGESKSVNEFGQVIGGRNRNPVTPLLKYTQRNLKSDIKSVNWKYCNIPLIFIIANIAGNTDPVMFYLFLLFLFS